VSAAENLALFRSNVIEVPLDSYGKLFVTEVRIICCDIILAYYKRVFNLQVLHPFYLFQVFSISVWLWDEYYGKK
jgi:hypothetical protein